TVANGDGAEVVAEISRCASERAPGDNGAIVAQSGAVVSAGGNGDDVRGTRTGEGAGNEGLSPIRKKRRSRVRARTPGDNCAVGFKGERVVGPGGNGGEAAREVGADVPAEIVRRKTPGSN